MSAANDKEQKRCGFAAVIGLPNAGKSTLVNHLVGAKVSIVSKRAQTTRRRVLGIFIHEKTQIILVDTPGVFDAAKTLEKAMVKAATDAAEEADVIIHLVDASARGALEKNKIIMERFGSNARVILALNKVDTVSKPDLLALAQGFNDQYGYEETYMISALKGSGTKDLAGALSLALPVQDWHFDADQMTDLPLRVMAAETTREKIFEQLYQELPYAVMVDTESWEEEEGGQIKIGQVIYVQKASQKAIILGKGGSRIKKIGTAAREDLEKFLERPVYIRLFVKVQERWDERAENFRLLGLQHP